VASGVGDARHVDSVADACARVASTIATVADHCQIAVESSVWEAPVASRYRNSVRDQRHLAEHIANVVRDLARALARHAEWIREREAELRSLEARIRHWAACHPPNPADPFPDASLITYWPAPLSSEWDDLAARLRANGAYF
jgi:hypothetical protein